MASIRERAPNRWQVTIRRAGYPRTTRTFGSAKEATDWAKKVEGEIDRGPWVPMADAKAARR